MNKVIERILLFIDNHRVFSAVLGLAFLLIITIVLSPLFYSIPVSVENEDLVVSYPLSVIPGKSYSMTLRSKSKETLIEVVEQNQYITIIKVEELPGGTPRERVTFETSSPHPREMKIYYAIFDVRALQDGNINSEINVSVTLDTISLPLRLLVSLFLSAPTIQIFSHLLLKKKS
ncbi:MAG: hypothetical protein CNIPEHKO_01341 [Anaerolineales bacterium]|nr:hypothetical protein [Anaerolineales bacterium]